MYIAGKSFQPGINLVGTKARNPKTTDYHQMKTIWLTDIHLGFLDHSAFRNFMHKLRNQGAEALLISGDIAQAPTVTEFLRKLSHRLSMPIYFVLGNHDYYHGSISGVRAAVAAICERSKNLRWLSTCDAIKLTESVCLVGHDGWGDGRLGDYQNSGIMLNDFCLIQELTNLSKAKRLSQLQQLGDEAANHLRDVLPKALEWAKHVVVLTHVPPFQEATWYEGQHSNPDWLPFFACKAVGDVLFEVMHKNTDKRMTVLCGHTHGGGEAEILPNLVVITGPASYGNPVIQGLFEWEQ